MYQRIEHIRHLAVETTSRISKEVQSLPWAEGLSQLERSIVAPNPFENLAVGKTLLESIAADSDFMIALVFNKNHTKVVALPLPEIHEGEAPRTELGVYPFTHQINLFEISRSVSRALEWRKHNPEPWVHPDVVLIEKQLGSRRKEYPIEVANLNTQVPYHQKQIYMDWIEQAHDELEVVHGKIVKNRV
jgi:hypothetical protein